ncbi:MAG: cytochrome P450 [Xanthobacteraceae bacterium]
MLPPSLPGLPILGNMLEFRRDPVACIRAAYSRLGPIFALRLGPKQVVVMIGPEYHRLFFKESDRSLTTPEVYYFLTPMFGEVLGACPFHDYKAQRRAISRFFARDVLDRHVEVMLRETEAFAEALGQSGEFELWQAAEHLALTIAAKAVLGADFWKEPGADFCTLFRDIAGGMDYILPSNLPLPRFLRRNAARRKLVDHIGQLVERRRRPGGAIDDLFQHFVDAQGADGSPLRPETVAGLAMIMVHGAYETVAAQACWCLIDLIVRPQLLDDVLREQQIVLGGDGTLTAEALDKLVLLRSCIQETMRLRPAATVVCRYAAKSVTAGPYTIPVGSLVMICPGAAHRLPDLFPEPDVFRADRFQNDPSCGDRHNFVTFGGGQHGCLGADFTLAEISILLTTFLRRFTLRLTTPYPQPDYALSVTRPKPPCIVRYATRCPVSAPISAESAAA